MVYYTFVIGLVCTSIATGYLSSAAHGVLVFGCGMLLTALALGMLRYLDGEYTKE